MIHDDPTNTDVGVGPAPQPWPDDPRLDADLLASGDRRNVLDGYRYWSMDAIVADLDRRRALWRPARLQVAIQNWEHDFNIGSIVRTANAFNVEQVNIVGRRRWNRRGAMVTDRYLHVVHQSDEQALVEHCRTEGLTLVGFDNLPGSVPLESTTLPQACCLVFGSEGPGLTDEMVSGLQPTGGHHPVRLHPLDQRRCGRGHRHPRVDGAARAPCQTGPVSELAARVDGLTADDLRAAGSLKWTTYPDAIGAWVAEMDFGLAPVVVEAVDDLWRRQLTGYAPMALRAELKAATARFVASRYGWGVDEQRVHAMPDVLTALAVVMTRWLPRGSSIIMPTPCYMPFVDMPAYFRPPPGGTPDARGRGRLAS